MASYKTPAGLDVRPTDRVVVLIDYNPKKGALNTVYWQAIIDAIAAGHSTVAAISHFVKNDPRYAHVPVLAEIRHNVGRGYYRLVRDERFGDEPPAMPLPQQSPPAKKKDFDDLGLAAVTHDMRSLKAVGTSKVREFGRKRLDAAIQEIRAYTSAYPILQKGHHFVFDYPLDKSAGKPEVLVMGINPGEVESQWSVPGPTESTWNYDFHQKVERSRSSRNWHNNALFFSNGRPVVFTDLFFWSASNQTQLEQRYGPLWKSPHLSFCVCMIKILLDEYRPKMVIFPGVGQAKPAAKVFGLRFVRRFSRDGTRLAEHYRDRNRPWYFTRHWSPRYGSLSTAQKIAIKEYIQGDG